MRRCKCQICKKSLTTNTAYCVQLNGKNKYYCSAAEYDDYMNQKLAKELEETQLYENIAYCIGKTVNTAVFREVAEWKKVATTSKLNAYFLHNKETILNSINRMDFVNEYAKIRYFSAIVKNSINDFVEPKVEIKHETSYDDMISEKSVYKPKKRVDLSDFI